MTTELALQQAPTIQSMDDLARMAEMFAKSGYFKDSKDAAQAGVRILCGIESGFGAFAAMTGVHVIQGKPTFGANLMAVAISARAATTTALPNTARNSVALSFSSCGAASGKRQARAAFQLRMRNARG
jgi:hypothetical protein